MRSLRSLRLSAPSCGPWRAAGGSAWCPYTQNSVNYDGARVPVGKEIVADAFAGFERVLDVGCGTGALLEWLSPRVSPAARLTGLEVNEGMMAQAQARLSPLENVELVGGSAQALPFADAAFDGVTIHQVLHHFPVDDDFAAMRTFCREAARVLRPGGRFVASLSTAEQYVDGVWFMALIPGSVERVVARTPSVRRLCEGLLDAGLEPQRVVVPSTEILQAKRYLQEGVGAALDKSFRDTASTWELATPEELEAALSRVRAMLADGSDAAFVEQRERARKVVGQSTFVVAEKPDPWASGLPP